MIEDFESKLKKLKKDYNVEIEEKKNLFIFDDEKISYHVKNLAANKAIAFVVDNDNIDNFLILLDEKPYVFNAILAFKVKDKIQIAISPVSFKTQRVFRRDKYKTSNLFDIKMNFKGTELDISLKYSEDDSFIWKFIKFMKSVRIKMRISPLIIEIKNINGIVSEDLESVVRNITNAVLFDLEYTYGSSFETISIDSLLKKTYRKVSPHAALPTEPINIVYKQYIPELIEYFNIAEKVDYLPFKFICYYHIIEYFSDKSAYHVVAEHIKKLILKPDFHVKSNHYIGQAINIFKKENDRYTTDKIKIERVLQQFIDREDLETYLQQVQLKDYFEKDNELNCSKPLKLSKVDFSNDSAFYQNLTKRIYSVRCSIVHSNPDFDDSKAIPFTPTQLNLDILRTEINLVHEIARTIIVESKE